MVVGYYVSRLIYDYPGTRTLAWAALRARAGAKEFAKGIDIFSFLLSGDYMNNPFMSLSTTDGEVVTFNAGRLAYVQTDSEVYDEGRRQADEREKGPGDN